MIKILSEYLNRVRLAGTILLWGDANNGNIRKLKRMKIELEYIIEHIDELPRDELRALLVGKDVGSGMLHLLNHVLQQLEGWRMLNAQMVETEWLDSQQRAREYIKTVKEYVKRNK